VGGVKVFHLIAEEVDHEFAPGLRAYCWGFNGQVHGPTIEAVQGDRVRIYVTNKLPENTSIHWHGLLVPSGMDGVAGLSQKNIGPGETYKYEFRLRQHGTYMYHSHSDDMTQIALGMMGMFVIHPRTPTGPKVDRDFALMSSEWRIDVGTRRPVPIEMTDFNVLTFNGRAFPGTDPLVAKYGDRVRIRFGNLSPMEHHPIHLHGFTFWETGREGARQPEAIWPRGNTTLVGVAQARDIEFVADRIGDWMLHCHLPHHMMNQMASNVGPMTRLGSGIQARGSMEEGMGMLREGHATAENKAPSLGRGLGVGSTSEIARSNGPLTQTEADKAMAAMPGMDHSQMQHGGMSMPEIPKNANQVPLFPQDAFMEGPMMAMDKEVEKPETFGLPPGWSGFVGGMMTFVRVLRPEQYDKIMDLKAKQKAGGNHAH